MPEEDKWLIAVTAGRWQKHGILEAKAAGLKVLAMDSDPNAEGFAYADRSLCIDFSDDAKVINSLRDLDLPFSGVVSFCSEAGMMLAATIRETFHLPGPLPQLCKKLLDKGLQRSIWKENNVPGPEQYAVFDNVEEAISHLVNFKLPFIIKPTDSSGSRGVTKVESVAEELTEAVSRAFQFSKSGKIIAESYMDGTEFTVEVFAADGTVQVLAITEKKKVEGTRGTVAKELATPNRPAEVLDKMKRAVIAAFLALGYREGPGHAEIILMKNGTVGLVEVAGRGGGFMVFDKFVPAASGVNIAKQTALQSVGLPIEKIMVNESAAVLRFFPSRPGILQKINGFEAANLIKGVEAAAFVKPGDRFSKATADGDRLGFILSRAKTPAEAQALADEAESKVFFDIKEQA